MKHALPLADMTTTDKLRVLEELWSNLQNTPDEVPSPAWHADVLQARERRVRDGVSQFDDWTAAKSRIRKNAT